MTCKECIHEKVCDALIKSGCPYLDKEIPAEAFCLEFRNTADVVPRSEVERLEGELIVERTRRENAVNAYHDTKSEVERWQAEVDQLHALLECGVFANSVEDWQKFLNEKRAEVAREIFADFTKHKVCTNEEDFRVLAELKKKYI